MKKLFASITVLILAFALSSCRLKETIQNAVVDSLSGTSSNDAPVKPTDKPDSSTPKPGETDGLGLTQQDYDDLDSAMEQFEAWALAQGWDENPYGNYIYGVWDSDVLPSCVPKELPDVKVDQTTYKEKRHDTYSGSYGLGYASFEDMAYEEWSVTFYCQLEDTVTFNQQMVDNGFLSFYADYEYYPIYHWYGNGYYAIMQINNQLIGGETDGYDTLAMFTIVPADVNAHPKTFSGTPLPTRGMVSDCFEDGGNGSAWVEALDDYIEPYWDVWNDKCLLSEPADYWTVWYNYFGMTTEDLAAYVQNSMVSNSWVIESESEQTHYERGVTGYNWRLKKGDIVSIVRVEDYRVEIGFSNMYEGLDY